MGPWAERSSAKTTQFRHRNPSGSALQGFHFVSECLCANSFWFPRPRRQVISERLSIKSTNAPAAIHFTARAVLGLTAQLNRRLLGRNCWVAVASCERCDLNGRRANHTNEPIRKRRRRGKRMSAVAITHDEEIGRAIHSALDHFDLKSRLKGKVVAIHPNDTWASEKDKTAVTQPDSLQAVLRYVKQFSPKQLVVTGGSGAGQTDEIFRLAGLMDVIEEEGAVFFDHNRPPFQEVDLDYGDNNDVSGPQKSVMVNPRVLEYETLIALNQLKVHETATVTMALKNIAMSFPAADYYGHPRSTEKHKHHFFQDMHSFIAAMAKRFPIGLAVTTGHPAMVGYGPVGGRAVETGLVIASTDPLAADAVGAQLLGFEVQGVRHLWEAARLGVGDPDVEGYDFPALDLSSAFSIFSRAAFGKEFSLEHA